MLTRLHLTFIIGGAALVWALTLWAQGTTITLEHLYPIGTAVTVVSIACVTFDVWAWRWPLFAGWLVRRPYLAGTWTVTLKSDWRNDDGATTAAIECFMVVRQTYSSLSLRLYTPESKSHTLSAQVIVAEDGVYRVVALYQSDPVQNLRGIRSEIHYGAMNLDVPSELGREFSGTYWTDRSTKGTLTFKSRKAALANSYEEATAMFD